MFSDFVGDVSLFSSLNYCFQIYQINSDSGLYSDTKPQNLTPQRYVNRPRHFQFGAPPPGIEYSFSQLCMVAFEGVHSFLRKLS